MIKQILIAASFVASFSACTTYQKAELNSDLAKELKLEHGERVSIKDFFRDPQFREIKISPDGSMLAAIFPQEGQDAIAFLKSDLSDIIFVGRFQDDRHILSFHWVSDTRVILQAGKRYGHLDGRYDDARYYFVDYDGKTLRDFFLQERAQYQLVHTLPQDPDHVVMARYHYNDAGRPTAVLVNVSNGRIRSLGTPPIRSGIFLADDQGEVNVAVDFGRKFEDPNQIYYRLGARDSWSKLSYPSTGEGDISPIHLDRETASLYLSSNIETGRSAIYRLNLKTGENQLISQDPKVDVGGLIMDQNRLVGVWYYPDYPELEVIDPNSTLMQLYTELAQHFPRQTVSNISMTADRSKAIVQVSSDRNPGEFYFLDIENQSLKILGSFRDWIAAEKMQPMQPVQITARDGLELGAYLTLPPGGEKKLPAVIHVHGGPHGVRHFWGFDPEAQFLASRGFAVLQVNYRGSGGYGSRFESAGYREWGAKMQDDLTDATRWLIEQGIADADRICIYGASYGGYASMMGVVREPDLYRCAVTYVGVSDLTIQTRVSDTSRSRIGRGYLETVLGTDRNELQDRSPLYHIDKLKVPVFIAHGVDDVRVPYRNATVLRDALDQAGKPYEWLAKESEGHGFSQEPNRFEFYLRLSEFLSKHTAPRAISQEPKSKSTF